MTKMIKMSLIAAVAVTGMTSAANAQNLEDAIKGVDVSGYVDYRLENKSVEATPLKNLNINEYAVRVNVKSKVNDVVTANVSVGFDEQYTDNTGSTTLGSSSNNQDANPNLTVINANFAAQLGSATVIAGKQAIPSAFVDKIDTAKYGAGVVAVQPINSNLTIAAAHFINNNITTVYGIKSGVSATSNGTSVAAATDTKTSEFIAMGNVSGVNYAAHYNITDIGYLAAGTKAVHVYGKLSGKISGVDLTAKYAKASADSVTSTVTWADSSVAQVIASGNIGSVTLTGAYAQADKTLNGKSYSTDVALDGDNDAEVHLKVWQASTQTITGKGEVMALTASMPVMTDVTASLTYAVANDDASTAADLDYKETLAQLTYKMSKNFTVHGRYSMLKTDTVGAASADTNYSRVQIKYTF